MTKIPKKAQVAFNQFIFDTMMDKLREVELLEKRIAKLEGSTHVQNAAHHTAFLSLFPRVEKLEQKIEFCLKDLNGGMQPGDTKSLYSRVMELERNKADAISLSGKGGDAIRKKLEALEKEIKDQREDYHAHIRQFVEDTNAALIRHGAAIEKLQRARDAKGRYKK